MPTTSALLAEAGLRRVIDPSTVTSAASNPYYKRWTECLVTMSVGESITFYPATAKDIQRVRGAVGYQSKAYGRVYRTRTKVKRVTITRVA